VPPQSKSSQTASAQLHSTTTAMISPPLHHLQWAPACPAAPTAILPVPPAPSAITAHPVQVPWAVHVNVTVSHAKVTVSNSTVEVHVVATVMTPVLAALLVARKNTFLRAHEDMEW